MTSGRLKLVGRTALGLALAGLFTPQAVVFLNHGDAAHNTSPPTGELAGSGWQWQGDWQGFAGTPIAINFFVTAKHLPGKVGDPFRLDGGNYRTVAAFPDPASDLVLWKICGSFASHAPLVEAGPLVGERCVVFGRGMTRGSEVTVTNEMDTTVAGWQWAPADGRLRWGSNTLSAAGEQYVEAAFDADSAADEATVAGGDSGGGLFVQQAGEWRLAGIHAAVDGPFRYPATTENFNAALTDRRGLEEQEGADDWHLVTGATPQPAHLYSTSIAARRGWIDAILAADSAPALPVLEQAESPAGPFAPDVGAVSVPGSTVIRVPLPISPRCYRLNYCAATAIVSFRTVEGQLELSWSFR